MKLAKLDNDLLTEIAVAYYQDGATQEEISKKFGVSRAKIGRLLKQARDEGIVEITVKYHPVYSAKIEQRLIERFGVKRALIALDQADEEAQRMQVGGLVSNYLAQTLKGGTVGDSRTRQKRFGCSSSVWGLLLLETVSLFVGLGEFIHVGDALMPTIFVVSWRKNTVVVLKPYMHRHTLKIKIKS